MTIKRVKEAYVVHSWIRITLFPGVVLQFLMCSSFLHSLNSYQTDGSTIFSMAIAVSVEAEIAQAVYQLAVNFPFPTWSLVFLILTFR